jgi:amino acid transporter
MDITNLNLKELWATQKVLQPGIDEIMKGIGDYKRSNRRQALITNLCLSATALFILFVWYYFEPQFATTKIGIIVVIVAIVLYIVAINQLSALFKKTDEAMSNQQYLENLLLIKGKQQLVQTRVLNVYFALLSTGIALYMYEYTSRMQPLWAATTYGITALWILFNWTYIRPRVAKKQRAKLEDLIDKLENIQEQLRAR